jgi:hypothetical protein
MQCFSSLLRLHSCDFLSSYSASGHSQTLTYRYQRLNTCQLTQILPYGPPILNTAIPTDSDILYSSIRASYNRNSILKERDDILITVVKIPPKCIYFSKAFMAATNIYIRTPSFKAKPLCFTTSVKLHPLQSNHLKSPKLPIPVSLIRHKTNLN